MSDGIIVLMLVLAVICVMLATQPAPPSRSRRSRLPTQTKPRQSATETDGGNAAQPDDNPLDTRFTALHSTASNSAPTNAGAEQERLTEAKPYGAAESALALWPANRNAIR